jgi:hypothetical protein
MSIEVNDFIPYRSNTLRGFFTVYFLDSGIAASGFSLHEKENSGARWIEWPAKRSTDGKAEEKWEKTVFPFDIRKANNFREEILKAFDEYMKNREVKVQMNSNPDPESK